MRMRIVGVVIVLLIALLAFSGSASAGDGSGNFNAHLNGGGEVPAVDTQAQGQATFKLNDDGTALDYKLIVANIEDVFASHIHCGAFGVIGPVGVTLFGGSTVTVNGILAQGRITAPNPGNACGWATLADVVAALQSGDTYVNVHTLANPGGEIRGQVR